MFCSMDRHRLFSAHHLLLIMSCARFSCTRRCFWKSVSCSQKVVLHAYNLSATTCAQSPALLVITLHPVYYIESMGFHHVTMHRTTPHDITLSHSVYVWSAGMTWLLSSKVVQMAEAAWLEQLQAFGQQVAAVGQHAAAQHGRITDWFLHQQGLFALGETMLCWVVLSHVMCCAVPCRAVPSLLACTHSSPCGLCCVMLCYTCVLCFAFLPATHSANKEKRGFKSCLLFLAQPA